MKTNLLLVFGALAIVSSSAFGFESCDSSLAKQEPRRSISRAQLRTELTLQSRASSKVEFCSLSDGRDLMVVTRRYPSVDAHGNEDGGSYSRTHTIAIMSY